MVEKGIAITLKEFIDLKRSELELQLLENAGVDNWEGYSEAWENWGEGLRDLRSELCSRFRILESEIKQLLQDADDE
jgi:hypothetical protein